MTNSLRHASHYIKTILALSIACVPLTAANADTKNLLIGKVGADASPLQEILRKKRDKGPILVYVPVAYVFGLGDREGTTYCSPSIRATNTSNAGVEELTLGIDYKQTSSGKTGGSTITRFADIKVKDQRMQYFYQLAVNDCRGLEGIVTVVRCTYTHGEDCSKDVEAVNFGTIPLRLKN